MNYRLGLDLGPTSLGWAVFPLDDKNNPKALAKLGVRIFGAGIGAGRDPKSRASLAETRRLARQARRRHDRLLKRKRKMVDALIEFGFLPSDRMERNALAPLDPYRLRAAAAERPLSAVEFGRAMLHINQRRGFKSNRKVDSKDNDAGALKSAISALNKTLSEEGYKTLGQWLNQRHQRGEAVRARLLGRKVADKHYTFYVDRSMIEAEFDHIWAVQSKHAPSLFSEAAHDAIKDILLFQRPLQAVRPGRCTLLPNESRAAKALPSAQLSVILRELNHLRLVDKDLNQRPLTVNERDKVLAVLQRKKHLLFTQMRNKVLQLPRGMVFSIEDQRDKLKGNLINTLLSAKNLLGAQWYERSLQDQDLIVGKILDETDERILTQWLESYLDIDKQTAVALAGLKLPEGYGALSKAALDLLIPALLAPTDDGDQSSVRSYDKAVVAAGFESHSQLGFAESNDALMASLPYYGKVLQRHVAFASDNPTNEEQQFGKIANPSVHIALNQIRVVVNALIGRYGPPQQVHIEVTRDLKLSVERRGEELNKQLVNQKRNQAYVEEACQILDRDPALLSRNERRDLSQRMQLWTELSPNCVERCCVYTGKQISLQKLFSAEIQIEHILPFSKTLDDSMSNKTIAYARANQDKADRAPAIFASQKMQALGYDYAEILERARLLPSRKAQRFSLDALQNWETDNQFLTRALNDTAYISRIAQQYLAVVCPINNIRMIPGRLTGLIRGHYGFNSLLSTDGQKNREDHRHHAIDAAIVGITDQALLQKIATANARAKQQRLQKLIDDMPQPFTGYRQRVQQAVQQIWVSHKPDHGYQGAILEATAWGLLGEGRVVRRQQDEDGTRSTVVKNLKVIEISDADALDRHGVDEEGEAKPYKGYVGGSNYCLDVVANPKGRWVAEVISTFAAYQLARERGEKAAIQAMRDPRTALSGQPLIMRLVINDLVMIETEDGRSLLRVCQLTTNGQIILAPHTVGNAAARDSDKADPFRFTSKRAGPLQKLRARRVTVSPDGRLNDPGFMR